VSPAERPLRALEKRQLLERLGQAFTAGDGPTGAHCIHELWMRGDMTVDIDAALDQLWRCAAATVPEWLPMTHVGWLPRAYEVTGRFQAASRGRANIYLVLLDYSDRRGDPHGIYVGMSRYTPAERFDQHKAGIRAARSVLRRGLEVLTGPTLHLQHIGRAEAERIETDLAIALSDAGILVRGGH
jgi:hypothetical protein